LIKLEKAAPIQMIIPIRCFTCGMVLADKYRFYLAEVRKKKLADGLKVDRVVYLTKDNMEKTAEGEVLDELRLFNMCCRRHMLTHVDIE
jgi:DNA-directed RNA polymerase I, II, and III subunit RPABC5